MRKIKNLNPRWLGILRDPKTSGEGLQFDCPICPPEKCHPIVVYFQNPIDGGPAAPRPGQPVWRRSGGEGMDFATLSVAPSIKYACFHGWLEIGRAIEVREAPITVMAQIAPGRIGPTSLSPLQAIDGCQSVIERAKVMLGQGVTGEVAPARVLDNSVSGGWHLYVGDTEVVYAAPEDGRDELDEMAFAINIFFGYTPEKIDVGRIEVPEEPTSSSIILPGH